VKYEERVVLAEEGGERRDDGGSRLVFVVSVLYRVLLTFMIVSDFFFKAHQRAMFPTSPNSRDYHNI